MHEAKIEETDTGRLPADDGWFILNLAEIGWENVPGGGTWCGFEAPSARSERLGIGVHILPPGETPGFYHFESEQEGFLVLSGECIAIVEGQERRLKAWDFVHCPRGTRHIFVGAGDGPCAILMVGTRRPGLLYPVSEVADRHGASVREETSTGRDAYAGDPPRTPMRFSWPL